MVGIHLLGLRECTMVGIHLPGYVLGCTMVGIHLPGYVAPLYTLGIPCTPPAVLCYTAPSRTRPGVRGESPGLSPGNNPG